MLLFFPTRRRGRRRLIFFSTTTDRLKSDASFVLLLSSSFETKQTQHQTFRVTGHRGVLRSLTFLQLACLLPPCYVQLASLPPSHASTLCTRDTRHNNTEHRHHQSFRPQLFSWELCILLSYCLLLLLALSYYRTVLYIVALCYLHRRGCFRSLFKH